MEFTIFSLTAMSGAGITALNTGCVRTILTG